MGTRTGVDCEGTCYEEPPGKIKSSCRLRRQCLVEKAACFDHFFAKLASALSSAFSIGSKAARSAESIKAWPWTSIVRASLGIALVSVCLSGSCLKREAHRYMPSSLEIQDHPILHSVRCVVKAQFFRLDTNYETNSAFGSLCCMCAFRVYHSY
jgi:hypothetical protein